jgi:hypothetical protein
MNNLGILGFTRLSTRVGACVLGSLWVASLFSLVAGGCSGSEATANVEVEVKFPSEAEKSITGSLHVFALQRIEDVEPRPQPTGLPGIEPSCGMLISGGVSPYDITLRRAADTVFFLPSNDNPVAEGVAEGEAFVYVEAVDSVGRTFLAGCEVATISGDSTVSLTLVPARVFDCGDSKTPEGSPCDDGRICTAGETCISGSCAGGQQRSCAFLGGGCSSGTCEEGVGCVGTALSNGTPCDDGQFCTTGDVCIEGVCSGGLLDCSGQVPITDARCQEAQCDENLGACVLRNFVGSLCDDGNECTASSACKPFQGTSSNCSPASGSCSCFGTANFTDNRACEDSNPCTTESRCKQSDFSTLPCSATGSGCSCRPSLNDTTGTACEDNNPCSTTSACQTTVGTNCALTSGACGCATTQNEDLGATCDDLNICTTTSSCTGFGCGSTTGSCSCDGVSDRDADADLVVDSACGGADCDDTDANVNPNKPEGPGASPTCSDGKDNDCDGAIDSSDGIGITHCGL